MELVIKGLEEIHPYENNPRKNDGAVDAVAESITEYGFKVPIVIDSSGQIICGHTRYMAAQMLGLAEVPCIVADDLSPEQVRAYRLADNKCADFSIWDNKKLLEELDAIEDDLFTGFSLGEIFDHVLDEADREAVEENDYGVIYEATFRSEDKGKIEKLQSIWDEMNDET